MRDGLADERFEAGHVLHILGWGRRQVNVAWRHVGGGPI
jgi:hypothetical protein